MNPYDPTSAHAIVSEYLQLLERQARAPGYPPARSLPYPKPTLKTAMATCLGTLGEAGTLSAEMRDFLESAWVALADFLDDELSQVMTEYEAAMAELAADNRPHREKNATPAWRLVADTGKLAGEIARSIAAEREVLRVEFRALIESPATEGVET